MELHEIKHEMEGNWKELGKTMGVSFKSVSRITTGLISSGVLFDPATFDLKGNITGTFQGSGGDLHTFDLSLTDPAATWTFTNVRVFDGRTDISSGTYTSAVSAIPEPSSWVMLSLGLLALTYRATTARRQLRA